MPILDEGARSLFMIVDWGLPNIMNMLGVTDNCRILHRSRIHGLLRSDFAYAEEIHQHPKVRPHVESRDEGKDAAERHPVPVQRTR